MLFWSGIKAPEKTYACMQVINYSKKTPAEVLEVNEARVV
jgi:hypothetical protein